jgi:hypothetical protein
VELVARVRRHNECINISDGAFAKNVIACVCRAAAQDLQSSALSRVESVTAAGILTNIG